MSMDDADVGNTEERHVGDIDGMSTDILPIQAHFGSSASKDMISTPRGIVQLRASVREAAAMHPLATPSAAFSQGCRDRPPNAKHAPSKQADLQVQAVDLSRENCSLCDFESQNHTSSMSTPEAQDMVAERSLDSRLSRGVEAFIGEQSCDGLDVQTCTTSRETSEGFLELLDLRVAALGEKLNGVFIEMVESRMDSQMAALESRFSSEMLGSRVESRLAALESHVLAETAGSQDEARLGALEAEILASRVETRLVALESNATEQDKRDSEAARLMDVELCALGKQIQTMSSRISKITSRSQIRTAHIVAFEEQVVALDRGLSELRCEFLEGCLRHHQMEELVIGLHSSIRELQVTQGENSKHGHSIDGGHSPSFPCQRHAANDLHAGVRSGPEDVDSFVSALQGERRHPKLETILETPIGETAESVPAEQSFVTQLSDSGKMVAAVDPVLLGQEWRESSLAEPEPETQECSTTGISGAKAP